MYREAKYKSCGTKAPDGVRATLDVGRNLIVPYDTVTAQWRIALGRQRE